MSRRMVECVPMARKRNSHEAVRKQVHYAVRRGWLVKPSRCPQCGVSVRSTQMHGHHVDYSKPLEVLWMCGRCHKGEHKRLERLSRDERLHQQEMQYREWVAREYARLFDGALTNPV